MLPSGVFAFVVEDLEGGDTVTNDPADPGGLTKWGISQRAHPALDIANLTREQALDIYTRDYWHRCRCDELSLGALGVALMVFDSAVNLGTGAAAKLLQRAVNVSVDGVLGPTTMAAARSMPARELIEALLDHDHLHLALLTGNYRAAAEVKLTHFELWEFFEWGAFSDDAADRNALVPIARQRAEIYDVPAEALERVIVIGDTPFDIECARVAGAISIAVATGGHSVEELRAAGADFVLADLSDTQRVLALLV